MAINAEERRKASDVVRQEALPLALPFLVAVAPILHLWSINAGVVEAADVAPLLIAVLVATAAILGVLVQLTRSPRRAALTVALLWLPVLTFGYQLDVLRDLSPEVTHEQVMIGNVAAIVGLIALVWWLNVNRVTAYATVAAAIFVASTVPGLAVEFSFSAAPARSSVDQLVVGPDIYFIVLDGYGRADVLETLYDHDNQPFLDDLNERGFYVAGNSNSNYAMTYLSLAATLNMEYLAEELPADYEAVDRLIESGTVIHALQQRGYQYVHFETEWWATANAPLADILYRRGRFESEFERAFFETTLLGTVLPPRPRHETVVNTLEDLREIPAIAAPTFTFVHLLIPHPPFMFDASGGVIPYADDLAAEFEKEPYVAQLEYVNTEMVRVVDAIVAGSEQPPVIIIQGDHGPAAFLADTATPEAIYWERHGILNAMLVPDDVERQLYPSVSPVNTFRLLLSGLFDADLPPLPDRAFYNWYMDGNHAAVLGDHLQLQEITDLLP